VSPRRLEALGDKRQPHGYDSERVFQRMALQNPEEPGRGRHQEEYVLLRLGGDAHHAPLQRGFRLQRGGPGGEQRCLHGNAGGSARVRARDCGDALLRGHRGGQEAGPTVPVPTHQRGGFERKGCLQKARNFLKNAFPQNLLRKHSQQKIYHFVYVSKAAIRNNYYNSRKYVRAFT
jgi:hypothetical protein